MLNYTIAHQRYHTPFMVNTSRRKTLKHQLIMLEQGQILFRIGKEEYLAKAGDLFWLPIDCLMAQTQFPGSQFIVIELSIRYQGTLPYQAGFVEPNPLTKALLASITKLNFQADNQELMALYRVLGYEISRMNPELLGDNRTLSHHLSQLAMNAKNGVHDNELQQLQMMLTLRDAIKLASSGKKQEHIVQALYHGDAERFQKISQLLLGKVLF